MSRSQMSGADATDALACQVYAIIEAGAGAAERLAALLAASPLTTLRIDPPAGHGLTAALAKPLVDLAQARDCAVLILDDAALARALRADGVHLSPGDTVLDRYHDARDLVGGGGIVGVDAGGSRHIAMEAGEAGADYIAFSAAPVVSEDDASGLVTLDDLTGWWAEVFEVPCVALGCRTPVDAARAAMAGADFVAQRFGPGETIAAAVERLLATVETLGGSHAS